MKKARSFILLGVVASFLCTVNVYADAKKGQKYYTKKFNACKKDGLENGGEFALKHSREEWKQLKEQEILMAEWKKMCPSGVKQFDKMKKRHIVNLYNFVYKYASDGDIPSCG